MLSSKKFLALFLVLNLSVFTLASDFELFDQADIKSLADTVFGTTGTTVSIVDMMDNIPQSLVCPIVLTKGFKQIMAEVATRPAVANGAPASATAVAATLASDVAGVNAAVDSLQGTISKSQFRKLLRDVFEQFDLFEDGLDF